MQWLKVTALEPATLSRPTASLITYLSSTDMLTSPIETDSVAARLAKAFGRVSRALRYRTRAAREALGMTDSEVELLRLVRRQPGLRVQDAATELGIASNSSPRSSSS